MKNFYLTIITLWKVSRYGEITILFNCDYNYNYNIEWQSSNIAFYKCRNLKSSAIDQPVLTKMTDMINMFYRIEKFNSNIKNHTIFIN